MYGDGLIERKARYRDSEEPANGRDKRWDSTTCMMSPSCTYRIARSTAARKLPASKFDATSVSTSRVSEGGDKGSLSAPSSSRRRAWASCQARGLVGSA